MKRESDTGISFFQRYLTVWVIICMVLGILIGKYLPSVPAFLNRFEYAKVSIPMAILLSQVAISSLSRSADTTEPPRRVLRNGIRVRTAIDW